MVKASEACELLKDSPSMTLGLVLDILPGHKFASIREGVEMTLTDAVAKSNGVPLWGFFGAASDSITTEITIPIVSPAEAAELRIGFKVPKTRIQNFKVEGGKETEGGRRGSSSYSVHPDCLFILDANEGYKPEEAIEVFEKLHIHRDDWEGLGHVTHIAKGKYGVSVAADESCHSLVDAKRIITGNLADVINIKLAKVGIVGGLEIIEEARTSGLDPMIAGMVETRLAMGFTGHLAAGFGCFKTGPNTGKENRIDRSSLVFSFS
ncbi:L-Ala-D/L-amino acid epimerase-like isoform X1 [Populus nigra]|uniref:L-Ala-D/L-amino acid epimerase-like isoform X1 n=1 Tax=Populus nigra TaxID=3691 RepID=UPI002B26C3F3|nr:L-Ala-D/L-amino acid epimerase-like isoform X1 [Populus nigra]